MTEHTMPMLTDEQREAAIERCKQAIKSLEPIMGNAEISALLCFRVALAALTAEPYIYRDSLGCYVTTRKGEKLQREGELVTPLYTAPPVPALKLPDEIKLHGDMDEVAVFHWNAAIAKVKSLNGVTE